jgi:hypothetical protein
MALGPRPHARHCPLPAQSVAFFFSWAAGQCLPKNPEWGEEYGIRSAQRRFFAGGGEGPSAWFSQNRVQDPAVLLSSLQLPGCPDRLRSGPAASHQKIPQSCDVLTSPPPP